MWGVASLVPLPQGKTHLEEGRSVSAPGGCRLEGPSRVQMNSSGSRKNIGLSRLDGSAGVEVGVVGIPNMLPREDPSFLVGLETGVPYYVMPSVPLLVQARRSRDELVSLGVAQTLSSVIECSKQS